MHPNVAAVAEKLAGVPLRLWHDHLLIKQPHNHAPTEFHQDQPFWPHSNFAPRAFGLDRAGRCAGQARLHDLHPRHAQERRDLRPQDLSDSDDLMSLWDDLAYQPRVTLAAARRRLHLPQRLLRAHMAGSNDTDVARVAHIIIYMDAATTYSGAAHVVTDPLGLKPGDPLAGEMFPAPSPIRNYEFVNCSDIS